MELFVAEVFDYWWETPLIVGVYMTESDARAAIDIVLNRVRELDPSIDADRRFVETITPVTLNGFTPACLDYLGTEV